MAALNAASAQGPGSRRFTEGHRCRGGQDRRRSSLIDKDGLIIELLLPQMLRTFYFDAFNAVEANPSEEDLRTGRTQSSISGRAPPVPSSREA
ncbi:hypothetical protein OC834_000482 [Tilletia horrida]|nr:hypothetical protein OC834_000482 [Tilletia horrida]KAK0564230.1 hypothetical protein OC844_001817 [Tilletia horrida]